MVEFFFDHFRVERSIYRLLWGPHDLGGSKGLVDTASARLESQNRSSRSTGPRDKLDHTSHRPYLRGEPAIMAMTTETRGWWTDPLTRGSAPLSVS
ncbi:hypothetical protein CRG98_019065 [Punica granatum]|uniref:Uncharacterized protein n=1 Tax=Punica granatum TaxID=22663 RepID=A0A2I0JW97_PUNGR|nr:hypothetical protein CRG98_019065 [Punica granatum]